MVEVDMNAPAFGLGSQEPEKEAPVEEVKEEIKTPTEEIVSEEPERVPYSKFKMFRQKALEAEEEAAEWRTKYESLNKPQQAEQELPSFWVELYGDSDASKRAWKIQSEQNASLIQKAREEAIEAVRNERYQETERVEQNVAMIDDRLDELTDFIGRKITAKEESDLLDIVDEYTPKDRDGNYSGDIIPLEKAWEIYELKNNITKAPKIASRNNVASLSGTSTQGEPSAKAEADKNFNPMDWNAYRHKL